MATRKIIFWTVLLIVIDQMVKLMIYHSFMDEHREIIPAILDFRPVFNSGYSYWAAKFGADMGLAAHLVLFSVIWLVLFVLYRFYHRIAPENKLLDISFIFQVAGFASAYISILFWKEGVLDFLNFRLLNVTCDLKDLYINVFIVLWIISTSMIAVKHRVGAQDVVNYFKTLFIKK